MQTAGNAAGGVMTRRLLVTVLVSGLIASLLYTAPAASVRHQP
jgi:hypothetical protein